jgi:hypothetical protein
MTLGRYLSAQTKYVPVDLVARDRRTIIRDVNREPPPATGMPAAACLGLLGYLHRPDQFMSALAGLHQLAVVSYKVADANPSGLDRQSEALVNSLSFSEMENLFTSSGWEIAERCCFDSRQIIWTLASARGVRHV